MEVWRCRPLLRNARLCTRWPAPWARTARPRAHAGLPRIGRSASRSGHGRDSVAAAIARANTAERARRWTKNFCRPGYRGECGPRSRGSRQSRLAARDSQPPLARDSSVTRTVSTCIVKSSLLCSLPSYPHPGGHARERPQVVARGFCSAARFALVPSLASSRAAPAVHRRGDPVGPAVIFF